MDSYPLFEICLLAHDGKTILLTVEMVAEEEFAPEKSSRFEWQYSGSHFRIYSMPYTLFDTLVHDAG